MGLPAFNSTEKAYIFIIYDYILRLWQKGVSFYEIYPFGCELY